MSTLSGIVSKGEKGKSKFQSLDINSLYRVSRGESLEQHQQKSTLPRKHGMQSLGKVPSARRPPANLPSLKSEYSSSDPAVSLVPSGGSGWATTKEQSPNTNTTTTTNATAAPLSDTTTNSSSQCAPATTSVQSPAVGAAAPPSSQHQQPQSLPSQQQQQNTQSQSQHSSEQTANKSSWSAIMSRPGDAGAPGQQQSQQNREVNAQYGPGPSLRPQTEGSWIQGGSRTPGAGVGTGGGSTQVGQGPPVGLSSTPGHSEGLGGGRPSLGQSPVMGSVPAGQPNQGVAVSSSVNPTAAAPGPNLHHYRGLIPPFMYNRGNFPASGGFPPQIPSNMSGGGGGGGGPRPRFNPNDRFPSSRAPQERERPPVEEEIITRPIIKEEDLTRMDDISHDPGWAAHDDIDYNQKLAFSDDENDPDANSHGTSSYNTTNANSVVKKEEKVEQPPLKDDKVSSDTSLDDKERLRDNESPRDPKDTRGDLSSAHGSRPWYQDRMGPSSGGPGGPAGPQRDYRATNGPPIRDNYNQSSQPPMRPAHSLRGVEEEEIWNQRRREHGEIVASAVVRARQRKEEEEKRFQESKQAAAKKLQDLEQKMKKKMAKKEDDVISIPETKGLISIPPVPIPVPEWERERENRERESRDRERSRTSSEGKDDIKPARESRDRDLIRDNRERDSRDSREPAGDFQNRSNFMRPQQDLTRAERERDRDQRENRDRDQPAFSRQFQSNLPPRFQKQQAERSGGGYNRVSPSAERTTSQPNVPFSQQYDPARWSSHSSSSSAGVKQSHAMPLPQRRRTDSDITNPLDDDLRPPSRDHGNRRDDRFRPVIHHIFDSRDSRKSSYHDDYNRGYKEDYSRDHDDRHLGRESWERDRDRIYDEKDRDSHSRSSRDSREFKEPRDFRDRDTRDTRDNREPRDSHGDSRISRDNRESRDKDYDSNCYVKQSSQQDVIDDREQRERSESGDWAADNRRDERGLSADDNRREPLNISREDRIDRNERPQRPDSRDSRTSRESKTSLREDDFHKSRDSSSWVHDLNDYEDKKRELYRDDHHRERERDRRQPPGPITREKLQADELKNEKRNLTQLKRGGSSNAGNVGGNIAADVEKKESNNKDSSVDVKKEPEVWNRKLERTPESTRSTAVDRTDNSPKAWADAVSPTFEKNEEKLTSQEQTAKDEKDISELKASMEKLIVEKREESHGEEIKDDSKDEKRDKNVRNRTNSGSFRGREPSSRGGRTWGGAYNVYTRGWRGSETRGRRGGGSRSMGRPGSAKSGSYGHTDSEISGDEISGSTESGKDERRSAVSPKPVAQKNDKDERNREVSRRDEKRSNEYPSRGDKRGGFDGRPSREGFAPSGEPSRRGRGGFRSRGATSGGRMEGYGPPPSKSPFSTERVNTDDKNVLQSSSPAVEADNNQSSAGDQSVDDKMIAKQQALTAGITGRRNKSPNVPGNQGQKHESGHGNLGHPAGLQKNQPKKEDARAKRPRSGSRRRDNRERRGNLLKNSADVGNEEWETTSENSEEHIDDHKNSRNAHNKHRAGNQAGSNVQNNRRHEQIGNNRDQPKSKANVGSRAPGAEKRNGQNLAFNQRNHSGMPGQGGGTQTQNGRPRSQGSANSGPNEKGNKETTINRVDEIKLSDPNLVDQVMKDMSKKSQNVQSTQSVQSAQSGQIREKKSVDSEVEANNYSTGGDDGTSAEDKVDADGFQEVRSKKNLKDSRLKEEPKPPRREKDKERERDRSKSKSNGPQAPTPQQIQNIPPLLGQPIPQPANMTKSFDRNPNRNKLAPRFQKQKLAKQQQQHLNSDGSTDSNKVNANSNYIKESSGNGGNNGGNTGSGPAPPPSVNAWDKPFTSQLRSNSPNSNIPADIQLMSGLTGSDHSHEANEQAASAGSSQRNSPSGEKIVKPSKESAVDKNVSDASSPPVQTLIFENTNYSKTTKTGPEMAIKSKFSNHMKPSQRVDKRDIDEDPNLQQQQQQPLSVAFSNKPANELIKDKAQDPIQMPLSFNKSEDSADMKLDFTFDADLSQLTEEKSKSLSMPRSMHMTGAQSTISPSTAELNLKIASVKKVWENASMPTVVEHEDGNVVSTANSFPQSFETADVDDSYPHPQYSQNNMKNEITTSTNVCKLVPPQVKPQQQSSGSGGAQTGSTVPGPSPIGPGQSPIGHPPASLQGPLSPPPFNSTGQPSHINYQEFPQYPGSQAAQYGSMSAIPSPPAVLFNTGSGQLPAQAGGLYGAFQLDQSRSPFTQYPPYGPSLQSSFNQQNVYLQQPPPPPHAPNAATPDMYQNNLSQYRIPAAAAPPFGQNQQLSNNPNTVLISSSSNSLMSASVKPSSQSIGAIGTKAPHFQAQSAQPNQLAYIPYDPNQVLGVSGNYMGNSQLVQRPGPNVQQTANSYYSATSADVFPGSQTGFYQPGGTQQTGTHYGLQGFGQHSQSLATGNATPVNLQSFSSQFLSGSGLQIAAAAAAQQYRNPTGGLQGPANAAATFLSKHQQQEQPRQLKSPSGNQQDVLASVFNSTPQIPSPKSRNCKQSQSQQPQPSPTQHHKYQQYQGVGQSALVIQQNVRGMGMPPRAGIQPSQQRYPPPIQRPVVPFPPGPNPNNPNQQQQNCIPAQQNQVNRHRPNLHQQQQRNMKLQQQYYSGQGQFRNGNKMDPSDKADSHNDKIVDSNTGGQGTGNKSNVSQQDGDVKEEVNQQNE